MYIYYSIIFVRLVELCQDMKWKLCNWSSNTCRMSLTSDTFYVSDYFDWVVSKFLPSPFSRRFLSIFPPLHGDVCGLPMLFCPSSLLSCFTITSSLSYCRHFGNDECFCFHKINQNHTGTSCSFSCIFCIFYRELFTLVLVFYCYRRHLASTRDAALFHSRIINLWNALPVYIVITRSVSCFKRYLLNYANSVGNDFFTSRYY